MVSTQQKINELDLVHIESESKEQFEKEIIASIKEQIQKLNGDGSTLKCAFKIVEITTL